MKRRGVEEEEEGGISRRTFLRGAVAAGTAGVLGATLYGTLDSLVGKGSDFTGDVEEGFIYTKPQRATLPIWYDDLVGQTASVNDFEPGQGASVIWRRTVDREVDRLVFPGFPAQLIRMGQEVEEFPGGYNRDDFIVNDIYAIFNCCTHACCAPGWKLVPFDSYVGVDRLPEGYEIVYCQCHFSMYDPRLISEYQHPEPPEASGARYVGIYVLPNVPAKRGMPLIPLQLEGEKLVGRDVNEEWYRYLVWRAVPLPQDE